MASLKDDAICIRHWDWSETSQTVSLFTHTHGIVRGLAKGSRREKSPFSGGIELAARGEVLGIVKSGPATGSLATITAWDLTETFPAIRRSLQAFRCAMAVLDCVSRSIQDSDPHPALFDATVDVLRRLDSPAREQRAALASYLTTLLKETGHAPDLARDILDGSELPQAGIVNFLPDRGGFTANGERSGSYVGASWRTRTETLHLLRQLATNSGVPDANEESLKRGVRLLGAYLEHVIESDIPALRSLNSAESA